MISGLVITLSTNESLAREALSLISRQPSIELGPRDNQRQPLVLETHTPRETQSLTDWLLDLSGVDLVDVAFVHLEPADEAISADGSQNISNTCS